MQNVYKWEQISEANPTIVSYNASAVNIYNATVRFEDQKISYYFV
jgi:hypothetical protein